MSILDELRARRRLAWEQAKALADTAANHNRSFTEVEETRWHNLSAQLDQFDERIEQLATQEQRAQSVEDQFAAIRGTPRGDPPQSPADREVMDAFRSAILERNPKPIEIRWDQPRTYWQPGIERRDLLTTAPGNLSPVSFYSRIVEHMVESSAVLRAGATLLTTDSGEPIRVPRTSALSTAAIVAEGAVIPESDPGLGVVTLGSYKYGFRVEVSTELVQDAGFDLAGYLARQAGTAIGLGLGAHLINGTGTGQPRGVLLDASTGVTAPAGTGTSFGAQGTAGQGTDLLYDLFGSLAEPYTLSPGAAWLLRNATLTSIRKLKTTTAGEIVGGEFVSDPPAGSGASATMIGKPAFVDPFMPAMANTAKSTAFGDWSRYFVRMVNGIRFERSNDYAFDRDMVNFRALLRADAALIDTTGAIKVLIHTT